MSTDRGLSLLFDTGDFASNPANVDTLLISWIIHSEKISSYGELMWSDDESDDDYLSPLEEIFKVHFLAKALAKPLKPERNQPHVEKPCSDATGISIDHTNPEFRHRPSRSQDEAVIVEDDKSDRITQMLRSRLRLPPALISNLPVLIEIRLRTESVQRKILPLSRARQSICSLQISGMSINRNSELRRPRRRTRPTFTRIEIDERQSQTEDPKSTDNDQHDTREKRRYLEG
ncbi:hypothetical protein V8E51_001629 [Hyaloscypha variabilis]